MSDTLTNALAQAGRSSSVLSGIANPAVVNPLAGYGSAISAVQGIQGLQEKAAQQAWGQALQQATDANGNVDYQKAQSIAAQMGPVTQMGMATNLANNANLQTSQIANTANHMKLVGMGAMTVANDPSDANVNAAFDNLKANGSPSDQVERERARWLAMSPADRQQNAYRVGLTSLDQLHQVVGQTTGQNVGGQIVPTTVTQPTPRGPGSMTTGPGAVTVGPSPDVTIQPYTWKDARGVPQQGTVGDFNRALSAGNAQPGSGAAVQSGAGSGPASSNALPPPPPGSQIRSPGAYVPPAAPATPLPAATPPAPTTPPVGSGAVVSPTGARSIPGAPPGATEAAGATATASAAQGSALTARADQVPTNKANYANMLTDLSKIDTMGPGTDKEVAINSAVQKLTGYGLTMTPDQIAAGNSFAKLANIAVGNQLQAIGGTDARQALFMGSNPNLDLSKLGNQQIIHMLQGNEDAIQAKSRAWQSWLKSGNGTDTYGQFQDDFNHHFDPRVFQQQYMGAAEIASLRKSLTGPGEAQKFLDDVKYARGNGWIQ